jgi:hypothetical protein
MNVSDVLIHINEPLTEEARRALEERMRGVPGVIAPRFNPGKEHLLMVAYDPEKTHSTALLEEVHRAGYTAQMVGA